jgi:hypothetical protein
MREKAITFGEGGDLVGILTEPDCKFQESNAIAVLFWNAGLLPRVGPHRMYVSMARKFSTLGFLALRFDLSGKGDSEVSKAKLLEQTRVVRNIQDAMDYLQERKKIVKFVLVGLCSGADDAFQVAVMDTRISGVVLLDAYGYRTPRFYLHYLNYSVKRAWRFSFKLDRWQGFLARKYREFRVRLKPVRLQQIFIRNFPPKEEVRRDVLDLINRGVNFLFIYSGGVPEYYTYSRQFEDMFKLKLEKYGDQLQVRYFSWTDHTYTLLEDRKRLIKTICEWLQMHYQT